MPDSQTLCSKISLLIHMPGNDIHQRSHVLAKDKIFQITRKEQDFMFSMLIVDDEPIILHGLVQSFAWSAMGFEVVKTASNGEDALVFAEQLKPDVLLTDIRMKKMNGIELIRTCSDRFLNMEFVVISAYRDFEYAKEACSLGVFDYLIKPFDDEQVSSTMTRLRERLCKKKQDRAAIDEYYKSAKEQNRDTDTDTSSKELNCIAAAQEFIEKNLANENLNISDIADTLYLNAVYFGRLFKRRTGITVKEYIIKKRLVEAVRLLNQTRMSIFDIACTVGISNHSYFTLLFRQYFGCSPSDYRRRHKKQ